MKLHPFDTAASAANTLFYAAFEETRGAAPGDGLADLGAPRYVRLLAASAELGRTKTLSPTSDIGAGREPTDPILTSIDCAPRFTFGVDKRHVGVMLSAMFGQPSSDAGRAWGWVHIRRLPVAGDVVTLNGADWTFGADTAVAATVGDTVAALADDLNATADPSVSAATYRAQGDRLWVDYATAGAPGNAFTLASADAAFAAVSGPSLIGGGLYTHTWTSGAPSLPSLAFLSEHPDLRAASEPFRRIVGARGANMTFNISPTGRNEAECGFVAINEHRSDTPVVGLRETAPIAGNPADGDTVVVLGQTWTFVSGPPAGAQTQIQSALPATLAQLQADLTASTNPAFAGQRFVAGREALFVIEDGYVKPWATETFSNLQGGLMVEGKCIGVIESGTIAYANNPDTSRVVGCGVDESGVIGDATPLGVTVSFTCQARFHSPTLHGAAAAGDPVEIFWALADPVDGSTLRITLPRVFLPEASRSYQAGQTISASLNGQASAPNGGHAITVQLVNDVATY